MPKEPKKQARRKVAQLGPAATARVVEEVKRARVRIKLANMIVAMFEKMDDNCQCYYCRDPRQAEVRLLVEQYRAL